MLGKMQIVAQNKDTSNQLVSQDNDKIVPNDSSHSQIGL